MQNTYQTALSIMFTLLMTLGMFVTPAWAQDTEDSTIYTIFVHEDCGHCQVVEAFVEENELEDHVNYLQLKDNDENMDLLEEYWDKFEIGGNLGWPLMIVNEEEKTYKMGDTPIIEYLADQYGIDVSDQVTTAGQTTSESSPGDTAFFIFGGTIVVAVMAYAVVSILKNED